MPDSAPTKPIYLGALLVGIVLTVLAVAAHRFLPERRLSLQTVRGIDTTQPNAP